MNSHQDAEGRGSEMMFVPGPGAEKPAMDEQPQNTDFKANISQDPAASPSVIGKKQEEGLSQDAKSIITKKLEEQLPADDFLHQMIMTK